MSELIEHAEGVHKILLTEEHARLGIEFSTNDIFIHDVVASDLYLINRCLRPLRDTDIQRDRVSIDIGLYWIHTCEDVAIVVIEVADSIFVNRETIL